MLFISTCFLSKYVLNMSKCSINNFQQQTNCEQKQRIPWNLRPNIGIPYLVQFQFYLPTSLENNDFLLGCSLDPSRSALKGACLEKFLLNWGPPKQQETTCWQKLVGGWALPLWKMWKSVGMILPNYGTIKFMFQATNQPTCYTLRNQKNSGFAKFRETQFLRTLGSRFHQKSSKQRVNCWEGHC